jgi:hypothetical protein
MAEIIMLLGFMLAAYSIVGNDSIQTLGTFLYSNSHRRWWILWAYSGSIMVAVMLYGWLNYEGDVSYDRLDKVYEKAVPFKQTVGAIEQSGLSDAEQVELTQLLSEVKHAYLDAPEQLETSLIDLETAIAAAEARLEASGAQFDLGLSVLLDEVFREIDLHQDVRRLLTWYHLIPPVALLLLTRFGFPVSTSFIILITFQPAVLGSMVQKSLIGYGLAFAVALGIYFLVMRFFEKRWRADGESGITVPWVILQWCSTAFLWAMWLIQDMANIFVYLPRPLPVFWFAIAIIWMLAVQAYIYYSQGGKIQEVVKSKTNTHDIRSATVVDLIYGGLLYYFKILSAVPMSTTWVFLGLLAGRELGFALSNSDKSLSMAARLMSRDILKAGIGLGVSVGIAYFIAWMR